MYKRQILLLLMMSLLIEPTASASCRRSKSCCPNTTSQGKFTNVSYGAYAQSRQKALVESQALSQDMKLGYQFEAKKQYANAEQSYRSALKEIALRDGPGSYAGVPALEHLAVVTNAQKKLDDAIAFQDTAVKLRKAQKNADQNAILQAQLNLSGLLLKKHDYRNAELVLKDSVAMYNAQPSLLPSQRDLTFQRYAQMQSLNHPEAGALEAADTKAVSVEKQTATAVSPVPDTNSKI